MMVTDQLEASLGAKGLACMTVMIVFVDEPYVGSLIEYD
jgi:hypothetical protein